MLNQHLSDQHSGNFPEAYFIFCREISSKAEEFSIFIANLHAS